MTTQESLRPHILFVCLGNICRSPAAEAVLLDSLRNNGLAEGWVVDSAGTSGVHAGHQADRRMRAAGSERGYDLKSISRSFDTVHDFDDFDWIIGMDESNVKHLKQFARDQLDKNKIHLFTDFIPKTKLSGVPDPYYGGEAGFYNVIDLIVEAIPSVIRAVQKNKP
jgi:protein-tyrosine phosphatase